MNWQPVEIVGGAYADDTRPWTSQDTVNWLPLRAERPGTKTAWILRSPPGLVPFCETQARPVRGMHNAEGLRLVVVGRTLYRVNANKTVTALGTIPGVGRVSISHNQTAAGNEVVIANGQSGYVYNTAANSLVQITDDAFPGSRVVDFIDSYIAGVDPYGRFWFISDTAQATQYNTLDRQDAESQPDKIVTLIVTGNQVLVFGERTGEFFSNTGQATNTFARVDNVSMSIGCASPYALARLDNTVYWLGHDGIVYRLQGNLPVRVSTSALEGAIADLDWSNAFAMTFEDRGHKVFYLTFPDGQTFGFDVPAQEWHRRESYGLKRWRINALIRWGARWYAGDFQNGRIYELDWDTLTEAGQPLVSQRRTAVSHADGNPIIVDGIKLFFDVGRSGAANDDHYTSIRYSDDGGHNWSSAAVESIGGAGEYQTSVEVRQLGMATERVWEVEVSSPAKRDLIGASWLAGVGQA
ncbi:packaged DNA stabilization protein [Lysobacter enzymogenes]|uniref:packaged DNA stabilization protein n=1 Tax=Lysobacter enzymogenes TaxID=69 RepID=UPI00384D76CB